MTEKEVEWAFCDSCQEIAPVTYYPKTDNYLCAECAEVTFCQYDSDNHSADRVTVWHGAETPTHLCGYHTTWNLNTILKGLKK